QLRQAPAQRAAGIVGNFPEQVAEMLAPEGAAGEREIGEQRAGLARRGQLQRLAVAEDCKVAQEVEREGTHCRIVVRASSPGHRARASTPSEPKNHGRSHGHYHARPPRYVPSARRSGRERWPATKTSSRRSATPRS